MKIAQKEKELQEIIDLAYKHNIQIDQLTILDSKDQFSNSVVTIFEGKQRERILCGIYRG